MFSVFMFITKTEVVLIEKYNGICNAASTNVNININVLVWIMQVSDKPYNPSELFPRCHESFSACQDLYNSMQDLCLSELPLSPLAACLKPRWI